MWITDLLYEVKIRLRDVYGLTPSRVVDGEPCFDDAPDGLYPMEIEGKVQWVAVIGQRFYFLDKKEPVK